MSLYHDIHELRDDYLRWYGKKIQQSHHDAIRSMVAFNRVLNQSLTKTSQGVVAKAFPNWSKTILNEPLRHDLGQWKADRLELMLGLENFSKDLVVVNRNYYITAVQEIYKRNHQKISFDPYFIQNTDPLSRIPSMPDFPMSDFHGFKRNPDKVGDLVVRMIQSYFKIKMRLCESLISLQLIYVYGYLIPLSEQYERPVSRLDQLGVEVSDFLKKVLSLPVNVLDLIFRFKNLEPIKFDKPIHEKHVHLFYVAYLKWVGDYQMDLQTWIDDFFYACDKLNTRRFTVEKPAEFIRISQSVWQREKQRRYNKVFAELWDHRFPSPMLSLGQFYPNLVTIQSIKNKGTVVKMTKTTQGSSL